MAVFNPVSNNVLVTNFKGTNIGTGVESISVLVFDFVSDVCVEASSDFQAAKEGTIFLVNPTVSNPEIFQTENLTAPETVFINNPVFDIMEPTD